jgi:hypothetical protein
MLTDEIINDADEKIKSLCVEASSLRSENKKLKLWLYILLGVSTVFFSILF